MVLQYIAGMTLAIGNFIPKIQTTEGQLLLWAMIGIDFAIETFSVSILNGFGISFTGFLLYPLNALIFGWDKALAGSGYGAFHLFIILSCILIIKFTIWSKFIARHD